MGTSSRGSRKRGVHLMRRDLRVLELLVTRRAETLGWIHEQHFAGLSRKSALNRLGDLTAAGYLQRAGELVELQSVDAREVFADNDLPVSTELTLEPGGVVLETRVVAHAPVRLDADDGRVAQFPRAWVSVNTADGRTGTGWVEWNRNRCG